MTTANDQIRRLTNRIHFAGALAELEPLTEGVNKNGVAYIRFNGVVQCGPTPVYCRKFSTYVPAQNAKGADSELYKKVKEWHKNAVPMTKNKDNPTMVDLVGSFSVDDYVGQDGKMHEMPKYSVQFFNDFTDYACDIDLEAYIKAISDEERGQDDDKRPTGRKRLNLLSLDFSHNVINLKNVIVPKETVNAIDSCEWEPGRTAKIFMSFKPNNTEDAKPARRGFGEQRTTSGASYLELIVVGGDEAYDEDSKDAIPASTAKLMMEQRAQHLAEVEKNGYQGKNGNAASSANRNSFNSSSNKTGSFKPVEPIDDDDIPF